VVPEGRSLGRSGGKPVALLQDLGVGRDNHRHWSMFAFVHSMNIRAFFVGCTHEETRSYRLSYKALSASACTQDCGVSVSIGSHLEIMCQ